MTAAFDNRLVTLGIQTQGKTYTFDQQYYIRATGTKLQKIVNDTTISPDKVTRTDYAGLFIYQNDTLQYAAQPEVTVRRRETEAVEFIPSASRQLRYRQIYRIDPDCFKRPA